MDKLRLALEQRSKQWKRDLRAEPKVARMLLRRLIGPIELWDEADYAADPPVPDFISTPDYRGLKEYVGWEAKSDLTVLFDRDYRLVASPTGHALLWTSRRIAPD